MHRASTQMGYSILNDACVLIKKEAYEAVGGIDPVYKTLEYAFADLFLRFSEAGYRNVYTPYVEIIMRDKDVSWQNAELETDKERLKEMHVQLQKPDPNYNRNLSVEKADYTLDIKNRS